ncbi:MAG: SCO family protein [Crocinitomicaceae bacterium]|nr:SCO family protein [Crocinitomicaceae bacterium]
MKYLFFVTLFLSFVACNAPSEEENEDTYVPLPYLGHHETDFSVDANGNEVWDTMYYQVPDFEFINQDSVTITQEDVAGKVYVANFFFTSCPSICPSMMEHMKRLQEKTKDLEELVILSHTIDPERDTLAKLRKYIEDREIDTRNWHLLYNEREYTHYLGKEGYLLTIMDSEEEESGGFLHSEYFVLIDRDKHIRGMYNGTVTEEVDKMAEDIRNLIENEYN